MLAHIHARCRCKSCPAERVEMINRGEWDEVHFGGCGEPFLTRLAGIIYSDPAPFMQLVL
jgi:hypothetical protein